MTRRDAHQFRVRQATTNDLEVLVRFSAAMALETEGRRLDLERLRVGTHAVLDDARHGFYLVAECAVEPCEIVGQLLITYEWSDWRNADFWWIQSVYVPPPWRRRGVYRAMHGHVASLAQARGACGLRLYVEHANAVAQSAYANLGMSPSGYRIYEKDFVLPRLDTRRA